MLTNLTNIFQTGWNHQLVPETNISHLILDGLEDDSSAFVRNPPAKGWYQSRSIWMIPKVWPLSNFKNLEPWTLDFTPRFIQHLHRFFDSCQFLVRQRWTFLGVFQNPDFLRCFCPTKRAFDFYRVGNPFWGCRWFDGFYIGMHWSLSYPSLGPARRLIFRETLFQHEQGAWNLIFNQHHVFF